MPSDYMSRIWQSNDFSIQQNAIKIHRVTLCPDACKRRKCALNQIGK